MEISKITTTISCDQNKLRYRFWNICLLEINSSPILRNRKYVSNHTYSILCSQLLGLSQDFSKLEKSCFGLGFVSKIEFLVCNSTFWFLTWFRNPVCFVYIGKFLTSSRNLSLPQRLGHRTGRPDRTLVPIRWRAEFRISSRKDELSAE